MSERYGEEQVLDALGKLQGWKREGETIHATYTFKDFKAAMQFVNRVADEAEAADHHPDIDIRWNTVRLALSTHSAGGLTEKDFRLAHQIEAAARSRL